MQGSEAPSEGGFKRVERWRSALVGMMKLARKWLRGSAASRDFACCCDENILGDTWICRCQTEKWKENSCPFTIEGGMQALSMSMSRQQSSSRQGF